jgi:hypothetical protein
LTSGTEDHTDPAKVTRAVHKLYSDSESVTDYLEFDGRGHSLTIDNGWKDIATATLNWLAEKGL